MEAVARASAQLAYEPSTGYFTSSHLGNHTEADPAFSSSAGGFGR